MSAPSRRRTAGRAVRAWLASAFSREMLWLCLRSMAMGSMAYAGYIVPPFDADEQPPPEAGEQPCRTSETPLACAGRDAWAGGLTGPAPQHPETIPVGKQPTREELALWRQLEGGQR